MRPEQNSKRLLAVTQSKAKMYEYSVPVQYHIDLPRDPSKLFNLTVGQLGDLSVQGEIDDRGTITHNLAEDVRFAARFFDSFRQSRLRPEVDTYVILLASASYYLSNLPGSSLVLAKEIALPCQDLGCLGLEELLLWILQGDFLNPPPPSNGMYGELAGNISRGLVEYYRNGSGGDALPGFTTALCEIAYRNGTPRHLLFSDLISALVRKRVHNSTWKCVPEYSNLPVESWSGVLRKPDFIRELWPSQQLLGKEGLFRGIPAVVQMPTSAGKTKAIEILIRSAFISTRASCAVVIAPFKALCTEIRQSLADAFRGEGVVIDEFTDVLQVDYVITTPRGIQQVLVTTPEKLVYVLRYNPSLSETIGLLIFDEGHQFDNGLRGVTYELLLTSLRALVPTTTQKVLISAVIGNADAVNAWLNGVNGKVISGLNLTTTYRSVAFTSWRDQLGRLEFVIPENPSEREYFVPRVIEQHQLQRRGRERKSQLFPEREDGQTIALFLGLRLVQKGSVAIFCGRKDTAAKLGELIVNAYGRGLAIEKPAIFSNNDEIRRLVYLYERNLGSDAAATKSAGYGIYTHHGNTPHGLRLAIENAMKNGLTRFVICTSTLAQGVNLPIRYLIVTSVYQGPDRIKVRDFQNLIGRAGRSGMHTEGSIIFADPKVYDRRLVRSERWRWAQSVELLTPTSIDPCASSLLSILMPYHSDDKITPIESQPLDFTRAFLAGKEQLTEYMAEVVSRNTTLGITNEGMYGQIEWRLSILATIESFLLAQWDMGAISLSVTEVAALARGTFAYSLATDTQRDQLVDIFSLLAQNIQVNIPEVSKRKAFGRTLLGLGEILELEIWVRDHIDELLAQQSQVQLLTTLWPIITQHNRNKIIRQCEPKAVILQTAVDWIDGKPFFELHADLIRVDAKLVSKSQRRQIKLDQVVDLCENGLGYDGTLLLGAITEIIGTMETAEHSQLLGELRTLQKRLKYGLPTMESVNLYEIGFSDRVISIELGTLFAGVQSDKSSIREGILLRQQEMRVILTSYPTHFTNVLDQLL